MTPTIQLSADAELTPSGAAGPVLIEHEHGHRDGPQRIFKTWLHDFGPAGSHTESRLKALLWCLRHCITELDAWQFPTDIFMVKVKTKSAKFAEIWTEAVPLQNPAQEGARLVVLVQAERFKAMEVHLEA